VEIIQLLEIILVMIDTLAVIVLIKILLLLIKMEKPIEIIQTPFKIHTTEDRTEDDL
jgi:hypothetical protein